MARARLDDVMQVHPFWVFDAGILGGNVLFPVFDPALAFSSASSPEIEVEQKEIRVGNWEFPRRHVKAANTAPITLSRGVRFWDSDMYKWITSAIAGKAPVRRSLCMIHFLGLRSGVGAGAVAAGAVVGAATGGLGGAAGGAIVGSFIDDRIPGRVWMLHDCIPTRYKAGGDFDASTGAVSIQELEIQPEHIVEVTVGTLNPIATGAVTGSIEVVSTVASAF
jgi:phage tail-like protein